MRPKVVLANGTFDPLHVGHILHLQAARLMGDRLVVALTCDKQVAIEKGPNRPVYDEQLRMHALMALRCVDSVVIVHNCLEALMKVMPSVFVKGCDYHGRIDPMHVQVCEQYRIRIAFTDTPKFSSTDLLKHYDLARQG